MESSAEAQQFQMALLRRIGLRALLFLALVAIQTHCLSLQRQIEPSVSTMANKVPPPPSTMDRRQLLHRLVLFTAAPFSTTALPHNTASAAPLIPETTTAKETFARDRFGSVLMASDYVNSKPARDRSLVLGLKDEPTYLLVSNDRTLENFALNAECSHLGCVVPWNEFEQKFECPCHGSKYDAMGNVLRGPAPNALALAHVSTDEESGKIVVSPWTETDFRTNEPPWWK